MKYLLFFLTPLFLLASSFHAYVTLDPDFGWHLRMGQIVLADGVPQTDKFSYTMPSYHYVDHEWLSDVIIAVLYSIIGKVGLGLIFGTLSLLTLLMPLLKLDKKWAIVPLLCTITILLGFSSIHPQVFSWFFFSLLTMICFDIISWQKWKYAIPLLFFIWCNLHASFVIGLVTLTMTFIIKILVDKNIRRSDIIIIVLSYLATLLNPYGLYLYKEILLTVSSSYLKNNIEEWFPLFFSSDPTLLDWIYIAFSTTFLAMNIKELPLIESVLFLLLLFAGVLHQKYLPFWIILSLPVTITTFSLFEREASRHLEGTRRFSTAYIFLAFLFSLFVIFQLTLQYQHDLMSQEGTFYPEKAVLFLRKHPTQGEIFSEYNWGGYLIWKLPEKKVFVDGRMPYWRTTKSSPHESTNAFSEWLSLSSNREPLAYAIAKYHITYLLLSTSHAQSLHAEINNLKWQRVYKDKTAVIYKDPYK